MANSPRPGKEIAITLSGKFMQLRDLKDGTIFRVNRTGDIAVKLGAWGDEKNRRVVQYQGQTALSTLNHQVAVEPLSGFEECAE